MASFVTYATQNNAATTTHTCTIPATAQVGDLLIALVRKTSTLSSFGAWPAGWADAAPEISLSGMGSTKMGYKVCGAGDPGATFTITTSSNRDTVVDIGVWRGVTATPLVAAGASNAANSTSHALASGLTPATPAIALMAVAFSGATEDYSPPAGYAEVMNHAGGFGGYSVGWLEVPAGAIGTLTYTSTASRTTARLIGAFYTVAVGAAARTLLVGQAPMRAAVM